jgi:hypothetical protein
MRLERYKQVQSQAKNRPIQIVESFDVEGDDNMTVSEVSLEEGVCIARKKRAKRATEVLSLVAGVSVYHLLGEADWEYGIRPDVSESEEDGLGTSMTIGS